jgi:hypothetical protein
MRSALVLVAMALTLRAAPVSAAALDRPRSLDEL